MNGAFGGGGGTFNPYDEPHVLQPFSHTCASFTSIGNSLLFAQDISLSALGHDVLNRAHGVVREYKQRQRIMNGCGCLVKEWTVKTGITSYSAWTSGENPEASQARPPSSSSSIPAPTLSGRSKAAQVASLCMHLHPAACCAPAPIPLHSMLLNTSALAAL